MTTTALARTGDDRSIQGVIAHHSKSFALASRMLPAASREDAAVLYAWCRRADDLVDGGDAEPGIVDELAAELDAVYRGEAHDPLLVAFGDVVRRRAIPRHYPADLLAGMAMDLAGTRYETLDDLIGYAWRVAGVVGLMMCHVIGLDDDDALVPAAHLGIAMQITNVCRDVEEDWRRQRLYLPAEILRRHGVPPLDPARDGVIAEERARALRPAVAEMLAIADRYYRSADRGLIALPWRSSLAIRGARSIYHAIGGELARREHDVGRGRAVVSKPRKLALLAGAILRGTASVPRRVVRRVAGLRHTAPSRRLELADVPRL